MMLRAFSAAAVVAALGQAPLQCSRSHDNDLRREDTAGDALYALAQDFRAKGNEDAARQTLRYLVDHYPSNRHVPAAREELEGKGAPAPAPAASAASAADASK
ncbi:MAG: hypothetical protein JST00_22870 [Deltaproteobacteria bacterium]|nr:hypothetical protein [Deltaproteobacteria bacterium]